MQQRVGFENESATCWLNSALAALAFGVDTEKLREAIRRAKEWKQQGRKVIHHNSLSFFWISFLFQSHCRVLCV